MLKPPKPGAPPPPPPVAQSPTSFTGKKKPGGDRPQPTVLGTEMSPTQAQVGQKTLLGQ